MKRTMFDAMQEDSATPISEFAKLRKEKLELIGKLTALRIHAEAMAGVVMNMAFLQAEDGGRRYPSKPMCEDAKKILDAYEKWKENQ